MNTSLSPIGRALCVAAFILGAAWILRIAAPDFIAVDTARRLMGAMLGALVVLYANVVPKTLPPLARLRCDPAQEQALRRFCARSLVLGGAGFALAWLFAPLDFANLIAGALLASAVLLVVLRYARAFTRPSQN